MNIIIVGCGKVGEALAAQLSREDNDITVIDTVAKNVEDISTRYDVMGVVGNGATHATQLEAGIDSADLLIAVTGSDELNLLCCMIAKKAGNCQTVARIKNPEYSSEAPYLKDELGLAMVINPEAAAAEEITRVLRFPAAIKIETFARGRVELLKFRLPEGSPLVGMSVKEVVTKLHCDILVCTVERGDEAHIVHGNFVFQGKDVISIIASHKNASQFFDKIDYRMGSAKNVVIAGGGETAHYLCNRLLKAGMKVKIVERRPQRCEELCVRFPDAAIICGDASDKELLLEEGVATADAFVALTNIDEENILLSLYAKNAGANVTVTKINRPDYNDVIKHLDLYSIIYPKSITADIIIRYVRAMKNSIGSNVETLYNFIQDKVEASEFVINAPSAITDTPLSELTFKDNVLIAAILRDETVIIPRGHDIIQTGDKVVIVSAVMALNDITDVLK